MFKFRKKTPMERIKADVKDTVEYAQKKGADIVDAVQEAAADVAHDAKSKARATVKEAKTQATDYVDSVQERAKDTYRDTKERVTDTVGSAQDKAKTTYKDTKSQLKDAVSSGQDKAKETYSDAKSRVSNTVGQAQDAATDTKERVVDAAHQAQEDTQDTYAWLLAQLATLVGQAQDKSKATYRDTRDRTTDAVHNFQDSAKETYSDTRERVGDARTRVAEEVSNLQERASENVHDARTRVGEGVSDLQDRASDATYRAAEKVDETKAAAGAAAAETWTSLADTWDAADDQRSGEPRFRWYHGVLLLVAINALAAGVGWLIGRIREKQAPREDVPETNEEQREYYYEQKLPKFAPPGWVFPLAWTINNISILAGLIRVLNKDKETPGRAEYLAAQKALWTDYILFNAGYFSLKSPLNAAVLTFAYLLAALSNLYIAAFRLKDAKVVVSLLTVLAWLGIAAPVSVLQALWNRDDFYDVGPFVEAPADMVK